MDPYFDLGTHSFAVTTNSPEAQIWFDRGLNWCYGFNHEEAENCFRNAIELDADCAIAYWGLAYAAGPNYNLPWSSYTQDERQAMLTFCYETIQTALTKVESATAIEKVLIYALANRFPADELEDEAMSKVWDTAYADAMSEVYRAYPEDLDVCTLTADALMTRTPWQLWDLQTGKAAKDADTLQVKAMLEDVMARFEANNEQPHPGILHYYIHLMEMSPNPEEALAASRVLGGLIPDSGHLHHMPSHIYVLCGLYEESLRVNEIAHQVNEKYSDYAGANNFYTLYRAHDIHFVMYSAMFLGQSQRAMDAAEEMSTLISPELVQGGKKIFLNYIDGFSAMRIHAYIRFGEWQKIIDMPLPDAPESYCVTTAMLHYAKGVGYAASGQIEAAEREAELFEETYLRVPEKRMIFNNESRSILDVGRAMLYGELEYRKQNYEAAYDHLRKSVVLCDSMLYTEPWVWMQPTRHALGALLLEQEHFEEAAQVYRADLGLDDTLGRPFQHLNNVWSLHGYHECLQRLGRDDEAAEIKPRLDQALALADIEINASCFCRSTHGCCDA